MELDDSIRLNRQDRTLAGTNLKLGQIFDDPPEFRIYSKQLIE
ncbi:MAG: hypothetical protein ACI8RD_013623 [Bacillariaceae sp.]|jgi:hypothetical protein